MPTDSRVTDEAFVTLATSDNYALGALVLSNSLRRVETTRQLVVMVTTGVSQPMRDQLLYAYDAVVHVDVLDSQDAANLELLRRPDLGLTFTKLQCWRLTQYSKCVFMDADTLVLKNVDELFEREELSAAPDVGWPDCFNSGVFVYRPSSDTYSSLLQFALTTGSFDGGDQGLLNLYFSDWATKDISKRLPFLYNVVGHSFYSYLPAFVQFGRATKVAHFIGAVKPWHLCYNSATNNVETAAGDLPHVADFVHVWWQIFMQDIHHRLIADLASLVRVIERHPSPPPPPPEPVSEHQVLPPEHAVHYETAFPFVPPDVQIYYEPARPAQPPIQPVHAPAADSRPYGHMESFYSEPPMAGAEVYPHPEVAYGAKETVQTLTELAPKPPEVAAAAEERAEGAEEARQVEEPPPVVEEEVVKSDAGAAAEAANLATFTKDMLADHEHQMNWERGQIDYLGVDSFDNILRQIDNVLSRKEAALTAPAAAEGPPRPRIQRRVERRLAPRPELCQTEHEESFVRVNPRKREVVSDAQLEECKRRPSRKGLVGLRSRPKPMSGIGQVDRRERVVRLPAGRRQQPLAPADLQALMSVSLTTTS